MPNPGGGMFGKQSSTKPVFYLGLLFGVFGLLFQWIAFGVTALIISNVLFGMQQALCGSALLFVLLHRWRKAKGAAVGAFLGALTFGELFGSVLGVLAIDRAATCTRAGAVVPHGDCDAQFTYAADALSDPTETVEACVCEGFRPAGPLFVAACLIVCLVGGLYYNECYLGPAPKPVAASAGDSTPAVGEAAPTVQSKPHTELKYIVNLRDVLASSVNATPTEVFKLVSFNDGVLRSCIAMLLCGGTIQGALHAAVNSLHHHNSSHGLDDQITSEQEKLLHGAYSLVVLVTAPMAGRASDRLNRKVFVAAGVMCMVLGSLVCASAVNFQSDTGGRRGELFLAALLHGIGTAVMYGAAVAAVAERALRSWRPIAVGVARAWWAFGRVVGYLVIDLIARDGELVALCMISLTAFVVGLYWILVFKDERSELGAQEDRPKMVGSDDEEEQQQPAAAAP